MAYVARTMQQPAQTDTDPRARIIAAAQQHFRKLGYGKTTMADIADAAGMSPANIYRFFRNKDDVVEACARLHLGEQEALAHAIADRDQPASERLRAFVLEVHEATRQTCVQYEKVHELVEVLCTQRRPLIEAHKATMIGILRRIIAQGQSAGEFAPAPDPAAAAAAVHDALYKFHHPIMVDLYIDQDLPARAAETVNLLLRGLSSRHD